MTVMADYIARTTPPAERPFSDEEVERGLLALVAFGGSPTGASTALRDAFELEVKPTTLRRWRDTMHADRYAALQESHGADIEAALVRDTRDLARAAATAERVAIETVMEGFQQGRIRHEIAATVALNMAKIKQSNIDKLLALTGRPQQITETRSAEEIVRALVAKNVLELPEAT